MSVNINMPNIRGGGISVTRGPNAAENFHNIASGVSGLLSGYAGIKEAKAKQDEVNLTKAALVSTVSSLRQQGLFPEMSDLELTRRVLKGQLSLTDISNAKEQNYIRDKFAPKPTQQPAPTAQVAPVVQEPASESVYKEQPLVPLPGPSPVVSNVPNVSVATPLSSPVPAPVSTPLQFSNEDIINAPNLVGKTLGIQGQQLDVGKKLREQANASHQDTLVQLQIDRETKAAEKAEYEKQQAELVDPKKVELLDKQLTKLDLDIEKEQKLVDGVPKVGKHDVNKVINALPNTARIQYNKFAKNTANLTTLGKLKTQYMRTGDEEAFMRGLIEVGALSAQAPVETEQQIDNSLDIFNGLKQMFNFNNSQNKVQERKKQVDPEEMFQQLTAE